MNVESGGKPLQIVQGKWPSLKTLRYGLLLAVSVATLSGCVSAVSTDLRADSTAAQDKEETAAAGGEETTTPVIAAEGAAQGSQATADATAALDQQGQGEAGRDMAGAVMQPANLDAGKASIYSNGGQAPVGTAYAAQAANTSNGGLFASAGAAQGAGKTGRLPVEDMPQLNTASGEEVAMLGDSDAMPENVPIPTSARAALVEEPARANAAEKALAALPDDAQNGQNKRVTVASLFADKATANDGGDGLATQQRRVLNRDSAGATQKASLGVLPGVATANSMFSTDHSESDEGDDDAPQFKEVASIAGLARLAPNGLWLQTEKVKTGCFKPELLQVLKTIEKHYDKPIIVTSGLRDVKPNREKQSLHTRCEAADIQISGVSKWELAEYLRSMPGRGGVGTYCHTESVHIDIGPERDWNWRCRARK
ncbi:YcbK family protein [Shinella zoogloeoides]|uniref:YcbK family protein n=1 Tax=Shinella zoogloeoides TaxID=352475 RepID=UPI000E651EE7|nr:YcbK family protein [Shinella zoogloeoides]